MSDNLQRRKNIFELIFTIGENFLTIGHKYCLCRYYYGPVTERNCICRFHGLCCICNLPLNFGYSKLHEVKRDNYKLTKMFGEILPMCSETLSLGCELFWEDRVAFKIGDSDSFVFKHEIDFLFNL